MSKQINVERERERERGGKDILHNRIIRRSERGRESVNYPRQLNLCDKYVCSKEVVYVCDDDDDRRRQNHPKKLAEKKSK